MRVTACSAPNRGLALYLETILIHVSPQGWGRRRHGCQAVERGDRGSHCCGHGQPCANRRAVQPAAHQLQRPAVCRQPRLFVPAGGLWRRGELGGAAGPQSQADLRNAPYRRRGGASGGCGGYGTGCDGCGPSPADRDRGRAANCAQKRLQPCWIVWDRAQCGGAQPCPCGDRDGQPRSCGNPSRPGHSSGCRHDHDGWRAVLS